MNLKIVGPQYICQVWPQVSGMIESSIQYCGGEYTADQLKVLLIRGDHVLLVAETDNSIVGAGTVSFIQYPNDRICFITAIGGKMVTGKEMFSKLSDWAKAQGCTKIQAACRESVARMLRQRIGMNERYRIVEMNLTP